MIEHVAYIIIIKISEIPQIHKDIILSDTAERTFASSRSLGFCSEILTRTTCLQAVIMSDKDSLFCILLTVL